MIFRLPRRIAKGAVCREPVTLVDMAPTILAAAGVAPPWVMHGRNLGPLLEKPDTAWQRPLVMEHFGLRFGSETDGGLTGKEAIGGIPWWIFLRQEKYKYVRILVPDEIEELYDLESDPAELHNLAGDPSRQARLAEFRQQMAAELKRTEAPLVDRLPAPRPARAKP